MTLVLWPLVTYFDVFGFIKLGKSRVSEGFIQP